MSKEDKNKQVEGQEDFILKKIRYYQGTIKDYDTFWNQKIAQGEKEESPETKSFVKRNAELNKAFEIIPVEKDDTVICTDVVSGKDTETPKDNKDAKPSEEKNEEKEEKVEKEEKKEKKEEKHEEEEETKVEDEKKEEKDDDEKKKKKKEDKE